MSRELIERLRLAAHAWEENLTVMGSQMPSPAMLKTAADALEQQASEIERLRREAEILRQYGNKDCTRMADAAIDAAMSGGKA
jgi:hypothetical protein